MKFEDGWLCMEYNTFDEDHGLWYLHSREFTIQTFNQKLETAPQLIR